MANDFVQVMTDGQEDAKTLSVVVNGDEQTQVETRLGETYPSVKKAIKVMTQAGVGFTPFESKNLMTLSDLANGAYAIVTNDTADNNGLYFKKSTGWVKVTWDIDERQKEYANEVASTALSTAASDATTKASDAKTQAVAIATDLSAVDATTKAAAAKAGAIKASDDAISALDSVVVNSGKRYPLKDIKRDNVVSAAVVDTLSFILDAAVINADRNYYYALRYYRNGLTTSGKSPHGWIVTKYPKNTYESASVETQIITTDDSDMPAIVRDGSIQTISLQSPRSPEIINVTVDTSKIQTLGEPYSYLSAGRPFWSWIIDPNCYVYRDATTLSEIANLKTRDSVKINQDNNYPLKPMTKNGVLSTNTNADLFLDAAVINADPDYYYSIKYYRNGLSGDGKSPNGWIIEKSSKLAYETASNAEQIITTSDEQPALLRSGIQTVFLTSSVNPEIIKLTINADKLQAYGSQHNWNDVAKPLWSWIIDPNCYIIAAPKNTADTSNGTLQVMLATDILTYAYRSGNKDYRVTIKSNGNNSLPNIASLERKEEGGSWYVFNTTTSDWLPPLRAIVDNNGDANYSEITTGGNHGKDGSGGGGLTARNVYYSIEIDSKRQSSYDGNASNIKVTIVNEVLAMNTVSTDRYAVRECFVLDISEPGVIAVSCDRRALEPLKITRDRGLQANLRGINDSVLYLSGQSTTRGAVLQDGGSGLKPVAPQAFAAIFQNTSGDQLSMSIDRTYGLGDTSKVDDSEQLFNTTNNGTSSKGYCSIIMGGAEVALAQGEGYQWRGSYQLKSIIDKPPNADSLLDTNNHRYVVYDANDHMIV